LGEISGAASGAKLCETMASLTLKLTADQQERLQAAALRDGLTVEEAIVRALEGGQGDSGG
jgi:hypothetical protein